MSGVVQRLFGGPLFVTTTKSRSSMAARFRTSSLDLQKAALANTSKMVVERGVLGGQLFGKSLESVQRLLRHLVLLLWR